MARTTKGKFEPSLEPLIETMGWDWVIQKLGVQRLIDQLGADRVIEQLNAERICAALTPRKRQQLKRLLEKAGTPPQNA